MNILSISVDYPNLNGGILLEYVHTRNKFYIENDINVDVLSFRNKKDYIIDGIKVYNLSSVKENIINKKYDLLICHAPNIKNHYKFLRKYESFFSRIAFIFHGHEVLNINKVYSKPYKYNKNNIIKKFSQSVYDDIKLRIWKNYLPNIKNKSKYIFVSEWMENEFFKWTKIDRNVLKEKCDITYNCVGKIFEKESYKINGSKDYDFITIRGNLDGSKYCVDFINKLAFKNPNKRFLIIGKGKFFDFNVKAKNLKWIDSNLSHREIIGFLNKSYCALMPTRTDAQGLMACEMATFGIPLITSNIPVCHEIFDEFTNVHFIDNEITIDLNDILLKIKKSNISSKNDKYFNKNTSLREIKIFNNLLNEECE